MTFGILALGFPVSQVLQPLGAHSLTFFLILLYLNAFLRWRLASWLWGSLFCKFCSLWGLTVSLFPILMHSLGDVWHPGSGVPCFAGWFPVSQVLQVLQPLGAHSLTFFPILMHSLGDVWHPGSGVPCFAGWFPVSQVLQVLQVLQPSGAHSLTFFPILMHSLGDVWHPGSGVPCFAGFAAFGSPQSHFLHYLNAFLRWRLASWLWGSLFRRFCRLWGLTASPSSLS